jgi:hypothetical protein
MAKVSRRFGFTTIINPRWRLGAKERITLRSASVKRLMRMAWIFVGGWLVEWWSAAQVGHDGFAAG